MRTLAEINKDIADVSAQLANVHGREAEVYTRIVGYYRSVRNWNKGKREEYGKRKLFDPNVQRRDSDAVQQCTSDIVPAGSIARIELYTRMTCPNCPPVINFCSKIDIPQDSYNVDTPEGFEHARTNMVKAAPTVICYDAQNNEIARAYSEADLKKIFAAA